MLAGGVALRRATRMARGPGSIVVTASRRGRHDLLHERQARGQETDRRARAGGAGGTSWW